MPVSSSTTKAHSTFLQTLVIFTTSALCLTQFLVSDWCCTLGFAKHWDNLLVPVCLLQTQVCLLTSPASTPWEHPSPSLHTPPPLPPESGRWLRSGSFCNLQLLIGAMHAGGSISVRRVNSSLSILPGQLCIYIITFTGYTWDPDWDLPVWEDLEILGIKGFMD